MGTSNSISDFKITVRLDSAKATAGLRKLQQNLNDFVKSARAGLNIDAKGVAVIRAKVQATEKLNTTQKGVNSTLRTTGRLLRKSVLRPVSSVFSILNSWKFAILGAAASIGFLISKITKVGAGVELSEISIKAGVASALGNQGFTKEQVDKISEQQKNFAQGLAKKYGLNLADTVDSYSKFFAASAGKIGIKSTEDMFKNLSELGVIYGLNAEKMKRAQRAFEQMAGKGKINAEELKEQLGDVLPGAMQLFADAVTDTGKHGVVTIDKLFKLMEEGKLVSADYFEAVSNRMAMTVQESGALEEALRSINVQMNKLDTQKEIFSIGAFNQFKDTLALLIGDITKLLSGEGLIVSAGVQIDLLLQSIRKGIEPLTAAFKEYQKMWSESDLAGKKKLANNMFTEIGKLLKKHYGDSITNAINNIDTSALKRFGKTVAEVIVNAIGSAIGDSLRWDAGADFASNILTRLSPTTRSTFVDEDEGRFRRRLMKENDYLATPIESPYEKYTEHYNGFEGRTVMMTSLEGHTFVFDDTGGN